MAWQQEAWTGTGYTYGPERYTNGERQILHQHRQTQHQEAPPPARSSGYSYYYWAPHAPPHAREPYLGGVPADTLPPHHAAGAHSAYAWHCTQQEQQHASGCSGYYQPSPSYELLPAKPAPYARDLRSGPAPSSRVSAPTMWQEGQWSQQPLPYHPGPAGASHPRLPPHPSHYHRGPSDAQLHDGHSSRPCSSLADLAQSPAPSSGGVVQWPTTAAAHSDAAAPQAAQPQQGAASEDEDVYPIKLERTITCRTYLKRLHITGNMAEMLLPKFGAASRSDTNHLQDHDYRMLFQQTINLLDTEGFVWPVNYEGVACSGQKHLRLARGWQLFTKQQGLEVGDAVIFERRDGNRNRLLVSIKKGASAAAGSGQRRGGWATTGPGTQQGKRANGKRGRSGSSSTDDE